MKPVFPLISFSLLFAVSCSTDLEVNAPYEDVPVVVGMLNPSDSVHYIKINKAFLGEMDAYQMAQVRDSSEYGDILTVTIEEKDHPAGDRIFTLDRVEVSDKGTVDEFGNPGAFYAPNQFLYRFSTGQAPLFEDATYSLLIKNNVSGKEITSSTNIVNDFLVNKPTNDSANLVSLAAIGSTPTDYEIKFQAPVDGKRYSLAMVMKYSEVTISTGDSVVKTIAWDLGELKSSDTEGGEVMKRKVRGDEFYSKVVSVIPKLDGNTRRYLQTMDFTIWVANEVLNTYMEVNEPSTGIIQEKPVFTNIENGIGIFGSRFDKHINDKAFSRPTADLMSDSPNSHPEYGYRFTHWYGKAGVGQPFQFIDLN